MTQSNLFETPTSSAPSQGRTIRSREASRSGARTQTVPVWTDKQEDYKALLEDFGPITDQDAAMRLRWPLSSVNSIRASLGGAVVADGYAVQEWPNRAATKRVKWRLVEVRGFSQF